MIEDKADHVIAVYPERNVTTVAAYLIIIITIIQFFMGILVFFGMDGSNWFDHADEIDPVQQVIQQKIPEN